MKLFLLNLAAAFAVILCCAEGVKGADCGDNSIYEQMYDIVCKALARGNSAEAIRLFEQGVDYNRRNIRGESLLSLAARRGGNLETLRYLIEKKGMPINDSANLAGASLLHLAASQGDDVMTRWLAENGADINAVDRSNRSVLEYALKSGKLERFRYLVQRGAQVNTGYYGLIPYTFELSEETRRTDAELNFMRSLGKPGEPGADFSWVHEPAGKSFRDILLAHGADVNYNNGAAVFYAIYTGNENLFDFLVLNGVNLNVTDADGFTPFLAVVDTGDLKLT